MLPFFYQESLPEKIGPYTLDEPTSKHCIQVLRMKEGATLLLTDGKGKMCKAVIKTAERKHTLVTIEEHTLNNTRSAKFALAIAFTKNTSRNEWLLEKATEFGIEHIYPIITQRTEKDKFKFERLNSILISAMLQSQQTHLPILHEPQSFKQFLNTELVNFPQKFIGHCIEDEPKVSYISSIKKEIDTLVFIGPEGDFSPEEVTACLEHQVQPVTFGENRLRTETAGMYACSVFNAVNYG